MCDWPQAWLRARGEERGSLFTAETVASQFGVAAASYETVPLGGAAERLGDTLSVSDHSSAFQAVLSPSPRTLKACAVQMLCR